MVFDEVDAGVGGRAAEGIGRRLKKLAASDQVLCVRDTYTFNFSGSPAQFVAHFRQYYGPTMNAFDAAEQNGKAAALQLELETLFAGQNRSGKPDVTTIDATFLRVMVTR